MTASWCARAGRSPWRSCCRPPPEAAARRASPRYSATTSPSPSPSSLRIASNCWRSRYSRCCLSTPSVTSLRIDSATCSSATWLRAQSRTSWTRSPTSTAASTAARLLVVELRPRGHAVGEGAGMGDGAQQLGQPARPAQLGDDTEDAAQLAGERLDSRRRPGVGDHLGVGVGRAPLGLVQRPDAGTPLDADRRRPDRRRATSRRRAPGRRRRSRRCRCATASVPRWCCAPR